MLAMMQDFSEYHLNMACLGSKCSFEYISLTCLTSMILNSYYSFQILILEMHRFFSNANHRQLLFLLDVQASESCVWWKLHWSIEINACT